MWGAVASMAAPIVGGVIGNQQAQGARNEQEELQRQALQTMQNVKLPEYDTNLPDTPTYERPQYVDFGQYESAGQLTPETLQTISQGPSEMGNVYVDPRLKEAQMQSLRRLQEVGGEGLTATDRARLAESQGQIAGESRGNRERILQSMRERGVSGSGLELAAMLEGQQASANRAAQSGLEIEGMAQQRALQAMQGAGQLGGQMGAQEFGQQADIAQAKDAINRFNAANSQDIMARNAAIRNSAQASNLQARQGLMNSNVDLRNQQQTTNLGVTGQRNQTAANQYAANMSPIEYKNQLQNQGFSAGMQKAGGVSAGQQAQAAQAGANADRTAAMWSSIGQGAGQGAAAYSQYSAQDDAKKKMAGGGGGYGNMA